MVFKLPIYLSVPSASARALLFLTATLDKNPSFLLHFYYEPWGRSEVGYHAGLSSRKSRVQVPSLPSSKILTAFLMLEFYFVKLRAWKGFRGLEPKPPPNEYEGKAAWSCRQGAQAAWSEQTRCLRTEGKSRRSREKKPMGFFGLMASGNLNRSHH